ncbi:hypothetical protein ABI59_02525 [Acidobacteria bacterium Mor1]|nr:hypothetical protein ABI59_02525 [Acidobacteria bacterium Mor1]
MRILGLALLWLGFIGTAWVASLDKLEVDWMWYGIGLVVCVAGVIVLRMQSKSEASASDKLSDDMKTIGASLDNIVTKIVKLDGEKADLNPYDAHGKLDELFPEDLGNFVEARKSIGHVHGLQAYAEVMNHFAAGERYMNRVWSASVDGYIDEVNTYLGRSRAEFERARELFQGLERA